MSGGNGSGGGGTRRTVRGGGNGSGGGTARPMHKRCGTTLARLYYTVYSRVGHGSRILPLRDWMWCERCGAPVHLIQRDMLELAAARPAKRERGGRGK